MNLAGVLNAQFRCARCQASGSWVPVARPLQRQNSTIHRLGCALCQEQIVAKVGRMEGLGGDARSEALREYETLCALQSVFPQDEHFGTLASLGYLEFSGLGIMITRYFRGDDLAHCLGSMSEDLAGEACRAAGTWLRKLHECGDPGSPSQKPDVTHKLDYLANTYGAALRRDRETWAAYRCLEQAASRISTMRFRVVRQHGDFKPQNMLYDGSRYVGLDIHWQNVGSPIYDLAPFLNHLWLAGRGLGGPRANFHYRQRESMFLAGYGSGDDVQAVRWAQLYFALCYLGGYRQRGRLRASYANWKVGPLVRELAAQLGEGS